MLQEHTENREARQLLQEQYSQELLTVSAARKQLRTLHKQNLLYRSRLGEANEASERTLLTTEYPVTSVRHWLRGSQQQASVQVEFREGHRLRRKRTRKSCNERLFSPALEVAAVGHLRGELATVETHFADSYLNDELESYEEYLRGGATDSV